MKMSTKGRYGLRMMIALAARHGSGPVPMETVAEEQGISGNYIHVLMGSLKAAGLVHSVRGPNGGYELSRAPGTITALEVISALEGDTNPAECVGDPSTCPRASDCPTREVWCEIASSVDGVLRGLTLAHLTESQRGASEVHNYCI